MRPNKIGKFELDVSYIRESPKIVLKVFQFMEFLPVRAEFMYLSNKIHYEGYSILFDEVAEGFVVPQYQVLLDDTGNTFSLKVERLD